MYLGIYRRAWALVGICPSIQIKGASARVIGTVCGTYSPDIRVLGRLGFIKVAAIKWLE